MKMRRASLMIGAAPVCNKIMRALTTLAGMCWVTLPALASGRAVAQQPVTAFVDASVVPMDEERVLAGQTVVVRGDRIVAVGSSASVTVPADARRIDGRGKFLMPGLGDMHAHNGLDDTTMFLYVANGVTTLRDLGVTIRAELPRLRRRIAAGEVVAPRIYGPLRNCGDGVPDSDESVSVGQLAACFRQAKVEGFDSYKLYGEREDVAEKIIAAARSAGLRLVGHVPTRPGEGGLAKALATPYHSIEHLWGYMEAVLGVSHVWSINYNIDQEADSLVADTAAWMKPDFQFDSARLRHIVAATRDAATWNVPTLAAVDSGVAFVGGSGDSFGRKMLKAGAPGNRMYRRVAALHLRIVKALEDGGAGLLVGSDFGLPGFSIHRELEYFVKAGLTPYQALVAATRNVATFLGNEAEAGTVAVGKRADLVLLDGNPLRDVRFTAGPAGVVVGGRWLPRSAIDARLDGLGRYRGIDLAAQRRQVWGHAGVP